MDKKDKTEEFIELFRKSLEEAKKMKSLQELTMYADASFGGIVRLFGKKNIMDYIAMLAACELQIIDFSEKQLTDKINDLLKQDKKSLDTKDPIVTDNIPTKKSDLN